MPAPPKQRKMAIVGSRSVGEWHPLTPALTARILTCKGKSSLTVRFVEGHFVESYYPTIENTFSQTIKHRGQDFATEIVDTAGQVSASARVPLPLPHSIVPKWPAAAIGRLTPRSL